MSSVTNTAAQATAGVSTAVDQGCTISSLISKSTAGTLRRSWSALDIAPSEIERTLGPAPVEVDWTEMVDAYPVFDRTATLRSLEGVTDPAVARRICEQDVPTFPLSSCKFPEAKWADTVDEPNWISVDNMWQRHVSRTWSDEHLQGVVEISGYQECRAPGSATFSGFMLDVALVDDLSTDAAKALAAAFNEIAKITAGCPVAEVDPTQALAIANIVTILEATELEVETLARVADALGVRTSELLRPRPGAPVDVENQDFTWLPDSEITEGNGSIVIGGCTAIANVQGIGLVTSGMVSIADETFSVEVARRIAAEILRQADLVDPEKTGADRDAH